MIVAEVIFMIVTFCGHRDVSDRESVKKWLADLLEKLIAERATEAATEISTIWHQPSSWS